MSVKVMYYPNTSSVLIGTEKFSLDQLKNKKRSKLEHQILLTLSKIIKA